MGMGYDIGASASTSSGAQGGTGSITAGDFIVGGSGGASKLPAWLFIAGGGALLLVLLFAFVFKHK